MRYPLAPLMKAAHIPTMVALRRVFPMNGTEYRRVLDDGLSERQADRWAIRLGLHPAEVWPEFGRRRCAIAECSRPFDPHPRAPHSLYCSPRCSNRAKKRRYRSTPHGAEANRRHRRNYYAENRGYELRQKKLARGTSVEQQAGLISPGQSDISDASTQDSTTHGAVAA